MKKIILLPLLALSKICLCTVWTITDSGLMFSPASLTISTGDTVNFSIDNMHNAEEVSQATWDANGTTPLPGFSVPFGGGMVLPAQLNSGTHYYVCTAHASSAMKGIIVVQDPSGIFENNLSTGISVYPNPSNGKFQLEVKKTFVGKDYEIKIYNVLGELIYGAEIESEKNEINLMNLESGIFFLGIYNGQAILTKKIIIR